LLTGTRSEIGESSGCLPYLLADKLNIPFIPNICAILAIDVAAGYAEVMQSLPRGQRRKLKTQLPFMASVGMAAPTPRQSSFGVARRGIVQTIESINPAADSQQASWHTGPARKRPKRLKVVKAKTAAERFKAATAKIQSSGGEKIYEVDKAAEAILKMLKEEKVL
jgi:electron transfer flavoprotein beta subunit